MEIVEHSINSQNYQTRRLIKYKMWKQSLYKWDEYIANRHRQNKIIDPWSQFCLDNVSGTVAVYNSGGMFFKDFLSDITVIEHDPCPIEITEMEYVNENFTRFDGSFDTLIMINPIALKYHKSIWHFLTVPGASRAGYKGNLLNWLKPGGRIFLSFSDWHMFYDRLKFGLGEFLAQQIEELESNGINCTIHDLGPSTTDVINGNVKLQLIYK